MTGTIKAVFCTSKIVQSLYRNCPQVCHSFGPCRSRVCSFGFAGPCTVTLSLLAWVAVAWIAARTISLSYSSPPQVKKLGV